MTDSKLSEAVARRIALAVAMIGRGAAVFALAHNSKVPFLPKARSGRGFLDARADPDMARTFLSNPGQLNYGVVWPEGSDVIVLDLDGGQGNARPHWRADWQALCDRLGSPGDTFSVETPSGGRHAYYRWRDDLYGPLPPGDTLLGWTVRKPWKGYVVGAGSVLDGRTYEPIGTDVIADLPAAWSRAAIAEVHHAPSNRATSGITIKGPATVKVGHRHAYLRDKARHLVGLGITGEALFGAVMDLNRQLPVPKTEDEVRRAIGEAEAKFEPDDLPAQSWRDRPDDALGLLTSPPAAAFPADPDPAAFEGLLGECTLDLAQGTDASLVGLLSSLIAFAGAVIPGRAYFHRVQTSSPYIGLVGESSIGRKGTAMNRASDALADAVGDVVVNRVILDGLNSGEGLVSALHYKRETFPNEPTVGLVFEEEYVSLLAARSRDGSTLDPKMRQAFDGGPLSNRRSNDTKTVDPPYWLPALIGITPDELRRRIEAGALQSGSANRWVYLPVARRDVRPSSVPPQFAPARRNAIAEARRAALVSPELLAVSAAVIDTLSEYADRLAASAHGLAKDLTPRYAVIAFRIALIHALVDRSRAVTTVHLRRAMALTDYARRGIPWIFGQTIGSADADLLLRQLAEATRLTKTVITRDIIRDPVRQQAAIDELLRLGRATVLTTPTGGRTRTELVFVPESEATFQLPLSDPGRSAPETVETMEESAQTLGRNVEERDSYTGKKVESGPTEGVGPAPTLSSGDEWIDRCLDYASHQSFHRHTSNGWTCDACQRAGTFDDTKAWAVEEEPGPDPRDALGWVWAVDGPVQ